MTVRWIGAVPAARKYPGAGNFRILVTYQAASRQGHLEQVFHIFAYLKHKPKLTLYFNPEYPNVYPLWFEQNDAPEVFRDQYRDAKEQLPPDYLVPEPLG